MSLEQQFLDQWNTTIAELQSYQSLPPEEQDPDVLAKYIESEKSAHECYLNRNRQPGDSWIEAPE